MRLLAISGSLRRRSYNSALLAVAAASCTPAAEFVVWRGLADIRPYNEDLEETPPPVAELRRQIARADAVLIATPEYNGSIPGALKNALDWASRPFPDNCLRGKPVAVIGASTGAPWTIGAAPAAWKPNIRGRFETTLSPAYSR